VAFSGDEQNQFASSLTLDTAFSLAVFCGEDFGSHRQRDGH
jgi:hypothetical protein